MGPSYSHWPDNVFSVYNFNDKIIISEHAYLDSTSVRPVVCLPSTVNATKSPANWTIEK